MATKVGINGFGRIGRCVARVIAERAQGDMELVGINDLTSAEMLAHLLEWDSVHGRFSHPVKAEDGAIWIGDHRVPVSAERDPSKLKWKDLGAEIVLECTGLFRSRETASAHLKAGAERVIISAPAKADIDGTFCVGINSDEFDPSRDRIMSCASCTTNCLAPLAKVLNETFGIVKGHMVTVHSYTNDQRILDLPHSDMRRARAAAVSIIPTSTGAAKAIGLVLPELKGKLDGTAIRVPTPNVSLTCLTAHVGRNTSRDEVNQAFKEAAEGPLRGILEYEERPLVSIDFTGNPHSSILDAAQTQVVGGDLVEVQSWYDNEWGFSQRMVDLVRIASSAR
ncbi:MAG: type I glyceraldehyde-3-phosphate dehydrogenase [Myxococcales bacterium]|nr:type I glyceraldehyde-3-phosphate dehydrogenase [Myxococcales bacterium]MDH3485167.1 type I glyceraldehyde-3-phosphate dehydrogenase [Myxococcales bacterium]